MAAVIDFDPCRRPAATVGPIPAPRDQAFESKLACLPEQVRPNLTLLEFAHEEPSGRRARSLERLFLRRCSGSLRRSSPSSARMSKAWSCTSSLWVQAAARQRIDALFNASVSGGWSN